MAERPGGAGASALLLLGGNRVPIEGAEATIGRRSSNDLVVESDYVSRHHARIEREGDAFNLVDLGSENGTYLNGERLHDVRRPLSDGDAIRIGGEVIRFLIEQQTQVVGADGSPQKVELSEGSLKVGRDPANDLVLSDPSVSRFHAELQRDDGRVTVRDLGSSNGTRLDGKLVAKARVRVGSEVGFGSHRLLFDGEAFLLRDDHGGLRLDAEGLHVVAGEREILRDASLSVQPGEFVAVIGESGAGKSTLVKALAGVDEPSAGVVRISGDPVGSRLTDLGYVPQEDIVHRLLTVVEALRFAARLRLPEDARGEDVEAAVERVLDELELTEHAATRIDRLSGGQRKRVGVAVELLNRPGLLFLDEPTTGLDPGLEARSMELFRRLASPRERAVVIVTHATRSLELCDRLVVMGRGGIVCFDGAPAAAQRFFGVEHYDEIYTRLDERPAADWRSRFRKREAPRDSTKAMVSPTERPERPPRRGVLRQTVLLVERYGRLLWRDRRNLLILGLQVPVLALAMVSLFSADVFDRPGGAPQQAAQLLFLVLTTATWFGAIDSAREIVKEASVLKRERAVGLRLSAYLTSKAVLLLTVAALQTVLMALIVFAFRPLDEPASVALGVIAILVLSSWVSVGMGLAISASVQTQDQATSFIPLALLPQLLFAGALVAVAEMGRAAGAVADVMFARWAFAGIGSGVDMNARIAGDAKFAAVSRYGSDFFELGLGPTLAILAGFLVLMFSAAWLLLRRRV